MFLTNMLFSVNIVLPIFFVLFLGAVLRRFGLMKEGFVKNGNALVFRVVLPVNLFNSVYAADVGQLLDGRFVAFTMAGTLCSFGLVCAALFMATRDKPAIAAMAHGAIRGNFALLGLPLITAVLGQENAAKTALVLAFVVPLYSVLAAIILTVCADDGRKIDARGILKNIATNPIIIGIFIGLAGSVLRAFTGFALPSAVMRAVKYISDLATPLALLCLGGSLTAGTFGRKARYAVVATVYKTVLQPLIFLPLAWLFGFRGADLIIITLMFAMPTAVASYAMTVEMKGDGEVAAATVMFSTLASVVTLTAFIYVFKALGWL